MTPPIAAQIVIDAAPEAVYAVYADVPGWSRWDPDTRAARLDGPLAVGSRGWLRPRKGLPVRMAVVQAQPGRSFTVECPVLGSRMRFEHLIEQQDRGVRVTHRVRFEGWLAGWLDRTVGHDVRSGLPATLARLKAQVEASVAAGSVKPASWLRDDRRLTWRR